MEFDRVMKKLKALLVEYRFLKHKTTSVAQKSELNKIEQQANRLALRYCSRCTWFGADVHIVANMAKRFHTRTRGTVK